MVPESNGAARVVRFGVYEVDLREQELRKHGLRVKLPNQPFQVLAILLEKRGEVVTREELYERLWPNETFVDFEHNLNAVVKKLRLALTDSAETPRFIDTVARRGYRFIAPVVPVAAPEPSTPSDVGDNQGQKPIPERPVTRRPFRRLLWVAILLTAMVLTTASAVIYSRAYPPPSRPQRSLVQLPSGSGLQFGVTWSPDRRFIAYGSDRGGKFDIWVQQTSGLEPVKITSLPGHNWQPDWSPDGNQIVFRSEGREGGIFVTPALGGATKKIADFGYHPRWSPDGRQVLFSSTVLRNFWNKLFVVGVDGKPPREILSEFFVSSGISWRSATWYPSGDRVSVWGTRPGGGCGFWTIPVAGGPGIESGISFDFAQTARGLDLTCLSRDGDFVWAPSGRSIYFAARSRGIQNLWRITVDRSTLEWKSLERLTTGPDPDSGLALSPDGKVLAFTTRAERTRIWSFSFDALGGSLKEQGQPVTPFGAEISGMDISPDTKRLVYSAERSGKPELWEQSLEDSRQFVLVDNGPQRFEPRWSPDGKRILYSSVLGDCRSMPAGGGSEQILSSAGFCSDWSPDGHWVIMAQPDSGGAGSVMQFVPVASPPNPETKARVVTSSRDNGFFQMRVSPNGRWVVFETLGRAASANGRLYTVSASGGEWVAITDGNSFDDKPRWSRDGKVIYFVSTRHGFPNVWGIRFGPVEGRPLGEPFRVTAFDSPAMMVGNWDLSVAANRMVLPMTQSSGNTWVIENPEL
jgi:Tol biopolymer transport system component/DNA-binding winged helix-turn-helix (wHTH) protein